MQQQQQMMAPMTDADGVPRILTKRKLQELVRQIDPQERLDPEVEDVSVALHDAINPRYLYHSHLRYY